MRRSLALSTIIAFIAAASVPAFAQRAPTEAELRQIAVERQSRDHRPDRHREPLTWGADREPGVSSRRAAVEGVACTLVTQNPFGYHAAPIVYSVNLQQSQFAYAPTQVLFLDGPQSVLIQHDSGLDEVVSFTRDGHYFEAVLTPEQDARIRGSLAQPGTFRFTHRQNSTTFDSAGAGDELAALEACEPRLEGATTLAASIETTQTAPPEPTPALQTLVQQGRWVEAIRFAASDNWTGRRPVNTRFVMSAILASPSANTPTVRRQLYNDREWMFQALSMAGTERAQMEAFVNGIVAEFAPFDPGTAYQINARTVGECRSRGGTVRGSTCWSH